MPRIPLYQQGNLASSAVGTPGVDTSGAKLAGSVAQSANEIANSAYAEIQANDALLRQKQRERDAAKRQLDIAQMDATANNIGMNYAVKLKDSATQIHSDKFWDTTGAVDSISQIAQDEKQKALDTINDPLLKAKAERVMDTHAAMAIDGMSSWVDERRIPVLQNTVKSTAAGFKQMLSDSSLSWNDVHTISDKYWADNKANYEQLYGQKDAMAEFIADRADGIKSRLADVANRPDVTPDMLEREIKHFGDALAPEKSHIFLNQVRQIAAQQHQAQQHLQMVAQQVGNVDWLVNLSNAGNGVLEHAPVKMIQQAISDPNTSPALKARLAAAVGKAKVYEGVRQDDNTTLQTFGAKVALSNKLHDDIISRWANLYDDAGKNFRVHGDKLTQQFALMQRDIDHYMTVYEDVKRLAGSVQTPEAKQAVQGYSLTSDSDLRHMRDYVTQQPKAKQMQAAKNLYRQALGAPDIKYSNPRQQQAYNYFYNAKLEEKWSALTDNGITHLNDSQVKNLRQVLQKYASSQVESRGFSNGR